MNILFPPRSATTRNKSSTEIKSSSKNFTFRDRQIRLISQEKNSRLVLNKSYINKPDSHLPSNDSKEVSLQLHLLKKNFDRACSEFSKRDTFIGGLKTQLEKISEVEKKQQSSLAMKVLEVSSLEDSIETAKKNQEIEEENKEIFMHVLDRMRTTIVHLKQKAQDFKVTLHKNSFHLTVEQENSTKTKQSRAKTANAMERLKNIIDLEKNEEKREIKDLEKNIEKRKASENNRNERRKKQAEIIEKAIIDSQSSTLEEMREQFFLNRLWYHVQSFRFEREKSSSKRYEDAYLKIKLETGIFDIPLFVEKFLTKEKDYRETLESVKTKEVELGSYKKKITKMQEGIEKFQMMTGNFHFDRKNSKKTVKLGKELKEMNEKKTGLLLVHDKVKKWANKMRNKVMVNCMDSVFETGIGYAEPKVLKDWFDDIAEGVKALLTKYRDGKAKEINISREFSKEIVEENIEVKRFFRRTITPLDSNDLLAVENDFENDFSRRPSKKIQN
jgi:hypothetical protein